MAGTAPETNLKTSEVPNRFTVLNRIAHPVYEVGKALGHRTIQTVFPAEEGKEAGIGPAAKGYLAGVSEELQTDEFREAATNHISTELLEVKNEIQANVSTALDNTARKLQEKLGPENEAHTYRDMKALLGIQAEEDGFLKNLGKKVLARIMSWSLPIASLVSANFAYNLSKEENKNKQEITNSFNSIYRNALGLFIKQLNEKKQIT